MLVMRSRMQMASTRSQAPAWERTLGKLCFQDTAFDRHDHQLVVFAEKCPIGREFSARCLLENAGKDG